MMWVGVDTSNYATSLAVVDQDRREVVYFDKRMLPVPEEGMGLRQSDAVFQHVKALPEMVRAMGEKIDIRSVQGVGVSEKPRPVDGSYMPCFLAGVNVAQAVASALGVPIVCTTHQQGHLAAALYGAGLWRQERRPMLVFHLSGGTTELLLAEGYIVHGLVGTSLDLYAGQAVDRLAARLGFAFPGGAELSALAAGCEEDVHPRTSVKGTDCHFSGLQNQCEGLLSQGRKPDYVAKFCLLSVAETMVQMLHHARAQNGPLPVLCAGGVLASEVIRTHLRTHVKDIHFASPKYSADNAVGVALIATDVVRPFGEDGGKGGKADG